MSVTVAVTVSRIKRMLSVFFTGKCIYTLGFQAGLICFTQQDKRENN